MTTIAEKFRYPARQFKTVEAYEEFKKEVTQGRYEKLPFTPCRFGGDENNYNGYRIVIEYDRDPHRDDGIDYPDTFGLHLNTRNYSIENGEDCPVDYQEFLRWKYTQDYYPEGDIWDYIRFDNEHYWLPIYIYSHSGDTINTTGFSCRWDSGMVGIAFISKAQFVKDEYFGVRKSWPAARREEWAHFLLQSWVSELDNYMTGEVYGFRLEKITEGDGCEEYEEIDSCWGYEGDESLIDIYEQCVQQIDHLNKEAESE